MHQCHVIITTQHKPNIMDESWVNLSFNFNNTVWSLCTEPTFLFIFCKQISNVCHYFHLFEYILVPYPYWWAPKLHKPVRKHRANVWSYTVCWTTEGTWVNAPIRVYITNLIGSLFCSHLPLSNCPEADYSKFDTLSLCAYLPCHCSMPLCKSNTYSVSCYNKINVGLWSSPLLTQGTQQYPRQNYWKALPWATKRCPWSQQQLKDFVFKFVFK